MTSKQLAAIIVTFKPEVDVLRKLIKSVRPQVDFLILVDNGGGYVYKENDSDFDFIDAYVDLGGNLGLGYALNRGFERALEFGAKYVATFDQDSAPPENFVENLLIQHLELKHENVNCAAVGPVFFDRRETTKKYFPFYSESGGVIHALTRDGWVSNKPVETDALITSGMLVRADVWKSGVRYDDGLFVDYTDTDWCFRARAAGYKLFGCMQIEMGHAPSDAPPARVMGLSFFRYSPLRRYYYFRNTVKFCMAPYVSWAWKSRLLLGLALRFVVNLVIDRKKTASLIMMARGVLDAFRGKTGEFT